MFQVLSVTPVGLEEIQGPLRGLLDCWTELAGRDPIPRIGNLDPRQLGENLGKTHLVEVMGRGRFRYLLYAREITNPAAQNMSGLTADAFEDASFGRLVVDNYQHAVDSRRPSCRHVKGLCEDGSSYEYIGLTLPFSSDGQKVDLLLVGTHRIAMPEDLTPDRARHDQRYVQELMAETTRCLKLMRGIPDKALVMAIRQFGTALLWNIAEMKAAQDAASGKPR